MPPQQWQQREQGGAKEKEEELVGEEEGLEEQKEHATVVRPSRAAIALLLTIPRRQVQDGEPRPTGCQTLLGTTRGRRRG